MLYSIAALLHHHQSTLASHVSGQPSSPLIKRIRRRTSIGDRRFFQVGINRIHSLVRRLKHIYRMYKRLISAMTFNNRPESCNVTSDYVIRCSEAESKGVDYENPKEERMGQTKSRSQCPVHKDEGYSQR
jgi:hypothetical protein